jgi:hypothetical protein
VTISKAQINIRSGAFHQSTRKNHETHRTIVKLLNDDSIFKGRSCFSESEGEGIRKLQVVFSDLE